MGEGARRTTTGGRQGASFVEGNTPREASILFRAGPERVIWGRMAMGTAKNRGRYDRSQLRYPSDLTDEEWALVGPMIPRTHHRLAEPLSQAGQGLENLNRSALAFLPLASIRLMFRKLCNPT